MENMMVLLDHRNSLGDFLENKPLIFNMCVFIDELDSLPGMIELRIEYLYIQMTSHPARAEIFNLMSDGDLNFKIKTYM
jgi:hypothetical protein